MRNPTTGGGGLVNRDFTNEGASDFSGVDVQLNWTRQLENGGGLNLNTSITHNLHEMTQDRPDAPGVRENRLQQLRAAAAVPELRLPGVHHGRLRPRERGTCR